jgi:hypothetical protein
MATQYDKMVVECGGDADIALALYEAGLSSPGRVRAASDEDVEEAVGSESLSAVRTLFPGQE